MKNKTHYNVISVEDGIVRHFYPKTWRNVKKYLFKGAESVFKEKTTSRGWYCQLVWSRFD